MEKKESGLNIFVYGTLMRGMMYDYHLEYTKFETAILDDHVRINCNYPVILKKTGHKVVGEIHYNITDETFQYLLRMEADYEPIAVTVTTLEGKKVTVTVFYPKTRYKLEHAENKYRRIYENEKQ